MEMGNQKMPHMKHKEHLCYLENTGYLENCRDDFKKLVKNARFICKKCGRSAAHKENLCDPDTI
jgi:hypothetical protein